MDTCIIIIFIIRFGPAADLPADACPSDAYNCRLSTDAYTSYAYTSDAYNAITVYHVRRAYNLAPFMLLTP